MELLAASLLETAAKREWLAVMVVLVPLVLLRVQGIDTLVELTAHL